MAFPEDGPATRDAVKAELGITDDDVDAVIDARVAAVNAKVLSWPVAAIADTDPAADDWTGPTLAHIVTGANMLAARLVRRRNSPDGTAALSSDVVGVALGDPDIALLLELGPNSRPAVG